MKKIDFRILGVTILVAIIFALSGIKIFMYLTLGGLTIFIIKTFLGFAKEHSTNLNKTFKNYKDGVLK